MRRRYEEVQFLRSRRLEKGAMLIVKDCFGKRFPCTYVGASVDNNRHALIEIKGHKTAADLSSSASSTDKTVCEPVRNVARN